MRVDKHIFKRENTSIYKHCARVASKTMAGRHERAIVVGSADEFGALVVNSGKQFVKRHPVISLSWVVGLFVSILASGYTPSPDAVMNYEVRYIGGGEGGEEQVAAAEQQASTDGCALVRSINCTTAAVVWPPAENVSLNGETLTCSVRESRVFGI